MVKEDLIRKSDLLDQQVDRLIGLDAIIAKMETPNYAAICRAEKFMNAGNVVAGLVEGIVTFGCTLSRIAEGVSNWYINNKHTIDDFFEMVLHTKKTLEVREFLKEHGWLFCSITNNVVAHFIESEETVSTHDIDNYIVRYFMENDAMRLKQLASTWGNIEPFAFREHIIEEAISVHVAGFYNSSITLLTVHTEGVVRDFLRTELQNPKYTTANNVNELKSQIDSIRAFNFTSFSELWSCMKNWENLEIFFGNQFDYSNPDNSPNDNRNKIAHGLVVEKSNEVDSLKRFLFLDEVFRIFRAVVNGIDEKTQQNQNEVTPCQTPPTKN